MTKTVYPAELKQGGVLVSFYSRRLVIAGVRKLPGKSLSSYYEIVFTREDGSEGDIVVPGTAALEVES